jgi:putative ABC transport system permease protein
MKFLGLVWSTLKRKKLRTILTLLSIAVAFLLFGFLCAIREAFTAGVALAGADRLIVRHKVAIIQSLPESYLQRIANTPGVTAVAGQSWFGGIYQDPKNFIATIPVDPEPYLDMYPELVLPPAEKQEWLKTRNGAIVGRVAAQRFGWKIGDTIPFTSPIWGQPEGKTHWSLKIVGIYDGAKKGTDTSGLFFRHDFFDEGRPRGKNQIGWFTVRIQNPDQAAEIARRIDEQFANSPYETKAEPEGAMAAGFAQQFGNIGKIMIGVLSAVFFTILLVAGNTMGQSVRERTEELGVLKAMGFTNELVLVLVLLESCLIAAVGGAIGLGLALLMVKPVPSVLPVLYLSGRDVILGLGIIVALGIVAGAIPAVQAMRLRIADALRRGA